MSLVFLFPLGLLALAAWALPLLLHLVRRERRTPTDFAALRWLALRTKPRARLRLDEIPLLAVRLALLAAIALLFARPALTGGGDGAWDVVHPSLSAPTMTGDDGVQRRWLAAGFPPLDAPAPAATVPTASLLRQLDAELPAGATLTVRVPARLDGLDGERPRLSRPVRWHVVGTAAPAPAPVLPATHAPRLAIRHDAAHAGAVRWLRAVAIAWRGDEPGEPDVSGPDAALPADPHAIVAWFASGPLPPAVRAWIEHGGTVLLAADSVWPLPAAGAPVRDGGRVIAEAAVSGRGRIVRLRVAPTPAEWPALAEPTFPRTLRDLLAPRPPAPARGDAAALAPERGGPAFDAAAREFPALLAWLVLALFALERMLATGRRGGDAA
jgi:hypothetical protein